MKITISGYSFHLDDKYSAGHVLDEMEAHALNTLRADYIRNRVMDRVQRAVQSAKPAVLPASAIESLQLTIDLFSSNYHFSRPTRQKSISPLEIEIEIVAKEFAEDFARREGMAESEISEPMLEYWRRHPSVQSEARKRLAIQQEIATIDEL